MSGINRYGEILPNDLSINSFANILTNAKTNGTQTTITGGVYLIYNFLSQTIYRYLSTSKDTNGYSNEDAFYKTLSNGVLSEKIAERNV